jgi:hypothetical protein
MRVRSTRAVNLLEVELLVHVSKLPFAKRQLDERPEQ